MRRSLALASLCAVSLLPIGCGYSSYEARLEATQRRLQDEMILNRALYGPAQGVFSQNNIFLRVPQGLAQRPDFELIPLNPGYFEVEASFNPQGGGNQLGGGPYNLHVLARRDAQEPAEAASPDQPPPVPRGEFRSDVLGVLSQVYGPEIASAPVEQVSKTAWPRSDAAPPIAFERIAATDRNQQLIHIYFYKEQSGDASYDVALIWEFPGGEAPSATGNPIDLTLGTFAVGQRAAARFSGRPEGAVGSADAGAAGVTF